MTRSPNAFLVALCIALSIALIALALGPPHSESVFKGWLSNWGLSDRIALIATVAGLLQVGALIATIVVTVKNGRRQLRAYVFPDNAGLFEGMMIKPPDTSRVNVPGVIMVFKNSGQTPAYDVLSWANIAVIERTQERTLVVPVLQRFAPNFIGAGGTMPKALWFNRALTAAEISDIHSSKSAIYLYGRIEYRDAFEQKRWANFRYAYSGRFPPPEGVIFSLTEQGNDAN